MPAIAQPDQELDRPLLADSRPTLVIPGVDPAGPTTVRLS